MVGIAVLAVLAVLAVPSFQSALAANRLTTVNNDLVSSLALARSEALRRGARVTVCKSATGADCTASGGWQQGWIVFVDPVRVPGGPSVGAGETIVARTQALPPSVSIQGNAPLLSYVSFAADGTVRTMAGAAQSGVLRVCSSSAALDDARRGRQIEVNTAGRLSTVTTPLGSHCPAP